MDCTPLQKLLCLYGEIGPEARIRLGEFSSLWHSGREEELFAELVFCLLTPQSRAALCWDAVEDLRSRDMLLFGEPKDVLASLGRVRFKYKKSLFVVGARELFLREGRLCLRTVLSEEGSPESMRDWLVNHVRGLGLKEASHFLRNIGMGEELAILDRHILKNLVCLGVIAGVPASLTPSRYMDIELRMRTFSSSIGIPMGEMDLILWYSETGNIFK